MGWTDSVTGQFFTDDEISGSIEESAFSPLDLIGGAGSLAKMGVTGLKEAGEAGIAKYLAKKALKKAKRCKTCTGAAKEAKEAEKSLYRGDGRSPDQIANDGGFQPKNPDANATLEQHVNGGAPDGGTQFVSTSSDQSVADSFGRMNMNSEGNSWVYQIDPKGLNGTDVSGWSMFPSESEVTVQGGVPFNNVQGWWQNTGVTGGTGSFTPNPFYVPKP